MEYNSEEKKPSAADLAHDQGPSQDQVDQKNPEHINLKVEFPEGEFTNFKIKRVTKMEKLMKAFYAQKGLQPGSVRLLLDDRRIHPNDTAQTLNAEEGDVINVYSEQAGGKIQDGSPFRSIQSNSSSNSLEQELAMLVSLIQEAEESIARLKREQEKLLEKQAKMEEQIAEMKAHIEEEQDKIEIEVLEMEVELGMLNIHNSMDED